MIDKESTSLEPQLLHISRIVYNDIEQITTKEAIVNENFRDQIDEFQSVSFTNQSSFHRIRFRRLTKMRPTFQ